MAACAAFASPLVAYIGGAFKEASKSFLRVRSLSVTPITHFFMSTIIMSIEQAAKQLVTKSYERAQVFVRAEDGGKKRAFFGALTLETQDGRKIARYTRPLASEDGKIAVAEYTAGVENFLTGEVEGGGQLLDGSLLCRRSALLRLAGIFGKALNCVVRLEDETDEQALKRIEDARENNKAYWADRKATKVAKNTATVGA
jgi:hypothetical protein